MGDKARLALLPSATVSAAVMEFTFFSLADTFSIDCFFFLTYCLISVVYTVTYSICNSPCLALSPLHSTVRSQINTVQTPIKRSLLAFNLPAFLPRALETEKGRRRVTLLRVLIQRNPTAAVFSLPTSPVSVQTPFHNSTPQPRVKGQVLLKLFLFIYLSSCSTVARSHGTCYLGAPR